MVRLHKSVNYYHWNETLLSEFCKSLNAEGGVRKISYHAKDRIDEKFSYQSGQVLKAIVESRFFPNNCFEYYQDGSRIEKACFRVKFNSREDLILVITRKGELVTCYLNRKDDIHRTLERRIYR